MVHVVLRWRTTVLHRLRGAVWVPDFLLPNDILNTPLGQCIGKQRIASRQAGFVTADHHVKGFA
jgi:hypothetical protein